MPDIAPETATAPMRDPLYAPRRLEIERRPGGEILLANPTPVTSPFRIAVDALDHWAGHAPDRLWLAERSGAGWRRMAYGEGRERARALAGGLAGAGLTDAPLLILARNGIDVALVSYAAMGMGAPIAPISPQYGLVGADLGRLAHAVAVLKPGAVFVDDAAAFAAALGSDALAGLPVIAGANARPWDIPLDSLAAARPAAWTAQPDQIAKLLLTSGSTGAPKAVIGLHSALAINAAQVAACFDDPQPPVVVNQAPWSHSLGANAILQMVLHRGGALYIDAGQPVAGRHGPTLENLREIAPTYHNMVPAGWDLLAGELERDPSLARNFFSRLRVMQYGGAALRQSTCDRIEAVALATVGETISFASGFGATETGPTATNVHWPNLTMGLLGLPIPGTTVKLAPSQGRLEFRVKGPQVSPGYHGAPEASAPAFDDEGFYRLGDAARFVDPERPRAGLLFDGRLSENFKLASGTFVNVGALRVGLLSAIGGAAQDAVVAGEGEASVGVLIFLNAAWCRHHAAEQARAAVRVGIEAFNARAKGAGGRVGRALILEDAPDPASGEIVDKGYINQTLARARRTDAIRRLFAEAPDAEVLAF